MSFFIESFESGNDSLVSIGEKGLTNAYCSHADAVIGIPKLFREQSRIDCFQSLQRP